MKAEGVKAPSPVWGFALNIEYHMKGDLTI
jgi:hypothetical protein